MSELEKIRSTVKLTTFTDDARAESRRDDGTLIIDRIELLVAGAVVFVVVVVVGSMEVL